MLDKSVISEEIRVSTKDAIHAARSLAMTHGFLVGVSSGANIIAARNYISKNPNRNVVTMLCDRGERYFSIL